MAEFGRVLYGWHDGPHDCLRLSSEPPDSPVRRSIEFADVGQARAYATRRRARIMWWPKLPGRFLNVAA